MMMIRDTVRDTDPLAVTRTITRVTRSAATSYPSSTKGVALVPFLPVKCTSNRPYRHVGTIDALWGHDHVRTTRAAPTPKTVPTRLPTCMSLCDGGTCDRRRLYSTHCGWYGCGITTNCRTGALVLALVQSSQQNVWDHCRALWDLQTL